jgi:ribosomal protein L25 (general stress protein Ctc)
MAKVKIKCGKVDGQCKDKLIKFMNESGQSALQVARASGKHHAIIYDWLQGKKSMKLDTWDLINAHIELNTKKS